MQIKAKNNLVKKHAKRQKCRKGMQKTQGLRHLLIITFITLNDNRKSDQSNGITN